MATHLLHEAIVAPATPEQPRHSEAAMIDLQNGRLLLAHSEFSSGGSDFSMAQISGRHSEDRGRTWSEPFVVVANDAQMNTFNPSFLRLPATELLLFYFRQNDLDDVKQYVRSSHDDGRSWGPERCITPDRVRQFMHNDRAVRLSTGRILLPLSWTETHTQAPHAYRSLCWFSDDDGQSWRRGKGEVSLPKRGAMEPVVVERTDGSVLMLIRTQLGHQYRAESLDGGDSWQQVRADRYLIGSEAPANIKRIPNTGDLLVIWNRVYAPYRRHGGRSPLNSAISRDDGTTWQNVRTLEREPDVSYAYPSIHFQGDEALLTYYQAREGSGLIDLKLKILPVDWFYASEAEQPTGPGDRPS